MAKIKNHSEETIELGSFDFNDLDIESIDIGADELLAPNGKPSNLTPQQYELVRTKEFKEWFGDWEKDPKNASKVVDENGEPLVVYRGFPKKRRFPNVFQFKYKMFPSSGQSGRQKNEFAFYFTDMKAVAEGYGKNLSDDEQYVIKEYFLNIRNLFKAFSKKNQYKITFKELYDLANNTGEPIYKKDFYGKIETRIVYDPNGDIKYRPTEYWEQKYPRDRGMEDKYKESVFSYFVDWDYNSNNQYFWGYLLDNELKYDGLVFYEETHNSELNPNRDEKNPSSEKKPWLIPEYGDEFSKTYGVFKSNQIKLADGTNTTFDKKNDDIRYEKGGSLEKDKKVGWSIFGIAISLITLGHINSK